MFHIRRLVVPVPARNFARFFGGSVSKNYRLDVTEEVRCAIEENVPVVALESTIITHGMPFPENVECAQAVEEVVRQQGAVPATIAILEGRIKVGLNTNELSKLADVMTSTPIKTSRRDLSYVVSRKLNGGTTVSGTLIVANKAGIPVFATGGIGGVHRQGEFTFDVSADLTELGRNSVACVSSGVKSILDVPKTLEFLETQGVFVATFGTAKDFPAFYCRRSNSKAPYNVATAAEAAGVIKSNKDMNLQSGMLFAVPVPEEYAMNNEEMESAIDDALEGAKRDGVSGKLLTPYLLSYITRITGGRSLKTNVALVKNNARVAADIAVELANLLRNGDSGKRLDEGSAREAKIKPFIIGGCNLDNCAKLSEVDLKLDGRLHPAKFTTIAGGVGRNICDALGKLGCEPTFLSAVGDDSHGRYLCSSLPRCSLSGVQVLPQQDTAQCIVVLDADGDSRILIGDMSAHRCITPELVWKYEMEISKSPLLIMDGNIPLETMDAALLIAQKHSIPVFYEPTDAVVAARPFKSTNWKAIRYISPNLLELRTIAEILGITLPPKTLPTVEQAATLAKKLQNHVPNVIVTLGTQGLVIARKNRAEDPLILNKATSNETHVRHYAVEIIEDVVNVSGAGDCLASALIFAMLKGQSEAVCVRAGCAAARSSLNCSAAVPERVLRDQAAIFTHGAEYKSL